MNVQQQIDNGFFDPWNKWKEDVVSKFYESALEELGIKNHSKAHHLCMEAWKKGKNRSVQGIWEAMQELRDEICIPEQQTTWSECFYLIRDGRIVHDCRECEDYLAVATACVSLSRDEHFTAFDRFTARAEMIDDFDSRIVAKIEEQGSFDILSEAQQHANKLAEYLLLIAQERRI